LLLSLAGSRPVMHSPRADHDGQTAVATVLDVDFGAATLPLLRQAVRRCASAAGLPDTRVIDVVLAVHELAANTVRHGGGHGHLLMQLTPGILHCQVSDSGPASTSGQPPPRPQGPGTARPAHWPVQQGHGLWLVHNAATHVQAATGTAGSVVVIRFLLPAAGRPENH
jgi:anti-sigma regulatory factor (Ser/Thr protein kinase)